VARVAEGVLPEDYELSVDLDRYQELMRLPIAAFNGLNKPDETPVLECSTIWKQSDRDYVGMWLAVAEEMREIELGYHLGPKWVADEEHEFNMTQTLNRGHLIDVGVRAISDISAGAALDLGTEATPNDPVVLVVATTVTDKNEIKVYYPDDDVTIKPSRITISGGNATINIPRSRLVKVTMMDDRDDPLDYYTNNNFITTVDVKRVYNDPSNVATIRWLGSNSCTDRCTLSTQTACAVAAGNRARRISRVNISPGTYSNGSWSSAAFSHCHNPVSLLVSYRSGRQNSIKTELLTARMAHTLMPNKPSSCPTVHQYWEEDIEEQDIWTPYGNKTGQFMAWVVDSRDKIGAGGTF
jgi:hypothetical protein